MAFLQSLRRGGRPASHGVMQRHHPVHQPLVEHLNRHSIVFLTVCSAARKSIFATVPTAAVIVDAWREADAWVVGRYVIMPDHVHLFCAPVLLDCSLVRWVRYWKSIATRRWPHDAEGAVWQRHFWDTQLRSGESYESKWVYVRENPVRHGLVATPEAWPYQGELNVLAWER